MKLRQPQSLKEKCKTPRIAALAVCLVALALASGPPLTKAARDVSTSKLAQSGLQSSSDSVWRQVTEESITEGLSQRPANPRAYRTLRLNRVALTEVLTRAPLEFRDQAKTKEVLLSLPMADGTFQRFRIEESPIMAPELAHRYPEIKTYRGQGIDDPTAVTRFDWTPGGFHAVVLSSTGTVLIEPYAAGDTANYISFFQKDVAMSSFSCETDDSGTAPNTSAETRDKIHTEVSNGTTLRTYRLAVAATAEYTQQYGGGTVSGGLAAVVTTVNGVDAIYERDVAIRLVLIANNDAIIFTDAASDEYSSDSVGTLIGENQAKLDAVIGTANYDIGHVFDGRAAAPGFFSFQGQASLATVCRDGFKARGVSITRSVVPSNIVAYYSTAHEMGHQFSASHTFNASTGSCAGQRTASTAYEPGTGSTIMGYRFTCGSEDLMSTDTYFHIASLEQIVTYTNNASGSSCAGQIVLDNQPPQAYAGGPYTIPQGTPFRLTATALDRSTDTLSYCWEEFDLGSPAPDTDDGSRPIFRSFRPMTIAWRDFPQLDDQNFRVTTFGESLPTTTRTMNFRVTVRDDRGGVGSAATQVNVRSDSGPFVVTQPVTGAMWPAGTPQTVTWSVGNTASPPINCTAVNILWSVNGFSYENLVNNTPNDGSEVVTLPFGMTVRIKVEAANNIFYNISGPFSVVGSVGTSTPTISGFSPASGPVGTGVTITGTNFADPVVRFNGTQAVVTLKSASEMVAFVPPGATTGPITVTTTQAATTASNFVVTQAVNSVQLSSGNYSVNENANSATITVTRTGDTSEAATVDYATADGSAQQRTDYTVAGGTLKFAAGETSKTFKLLISDDVQVEGDQQLALSLSNAVGASLGTPNSATLTIVDNDGSPPLANPVDTTPFFVRQHYYDFLSRDPDPGGLGFWIGQIDGVCPPTDLICLAHRRRDVSDAFFFEPEFQQTGGYVFRLYRAAYGDLQPFPNPDPGNLIEAQKLPSYAAFMSDRAKVVAGSNLAEAQLALANEFVRRPEFLAHYPASMNGGAFIHELLSRMLDARMSSQEPALLNQYYLGGRGLVLYRLADDSPQNQINNRPFIDAEYRRTFVFTEYAGYLRRDPDVGGLLFWLNQVNQFPVRDPGIQHTMACAFITSAEYQQRFSSVVTRSNQECGQ